MRTDMLLAPSWECVHFVEAPAEVAYDSLRELGISILEVNGEGISDKDTFLELISDAMRFPDYFGANWDAVDECLRDLEWIPARGYIVVVHHSAGLWSRLPKVVAAFLSCWIHAAEEWASQDIPFHLIFEW